MAHDDAPGELKLPRTIRLDASDDAAYQHAAGAGEWAVPGGFEFLDAGELSGPAKQAFRNGFLGTETFGRATLVAVGRISAEEYEEVVARLASHLEQHYGAPDRDAAERAARGEVDFAASLCEHPPNTLLAVQREWTEEGVAESFRVVSQPGGDWEGDNPIAMEPE